MCKARLIEALQALGLAIFWIGLALVLGKNWWFIPIPLIGICLRGYALWWVRGWLRPKLWATLGFHAALGTLIALFAGIMTDVDLVQTYSFFGFWLAGVWFLGKCAVLVAMAFFERRKPVG